jgi:outer membrane protein assembly factor BamE (lipoprotein component of BamABCDE complex)
MKKLLTALFLACLFLTGCTTNKAEQIEKSNLTAGMVKKTIIEGVTTQNEILKVFGAPNIVTKNKSGNEVWTYDTVSVVNSGEEGYWNVVVGGASGGKSSASTKTFILMIEFDNNSVVKECSYRASAF